MALTGDTATQEETFDVPVVARGTFLGQRHPSSGRKQGQPEAPVKDHALRPSEVLALTG